MSSTSTALREDALSARPDGFELRVGLPWIRSMPLSGVSKLNVTLDGQRLAERELNILLGSRRVAPSALADEVNRWWFLQDRLVVRGTGVLEAGAHRVCVDFTMLVPYLSASPGTPLVLPFHLEAQLELDHPPLPSVARDVA
jgi:Domain of unknown function (DUF6379)